MLPVGDLRLKALDLGVLDVDVIVDELRAEFFAEKFVVVQRLDGVDRKLDPGPSADTPYETKAAMLPKSLREAVFALNDDPFFRDTLGAAFVDYYVHIKNAEIERFQAEVSDWEHREYFEMF